MSATDTQKWEDPLRRYTSPSTVKVSLVGSASLSLSPLMNLINQRCQHRIVPHFPMHFYETLFSHAVNSRSQVSLITATSAAWGGGTASINDGVSACWRNSVFDATYPGSCPTGFEPAKHIFFCITITQSVDSTSRSTLFVFFFWG